MGNGESTRTASPKNGYKYGGARRNSSPETSSTRQGTDQITEQLCQLLVTNSRKHGVGDDIISRQSFVDHFRSEKVPEAGLLLYIRFGGGRRPSVDAPSEPPPAIGRETFLKFCNEIRNLIVDSHQQRYYLLLFSKGRPTIEKNDVEQLFRTCFLLEAELVGSKYDCDPQSPLLTSILQSLTQACLRQENQVTIDALQAWIAKTCSKIVHSSIHRWVIQHLLPTKTIFKFKSNDGFGWTRLYSNTVNGESMNRFQHHVFSYRGPTAMIIRTDSDVSLCIGVDHEWREHNSRWGGEHCIIIQMTPCFKIFEVGDRMMYFNLTARGYPIGLHVGRNPKSPVLEIDPDFCVASVKKIPYKLETIEVWGCAEEETLDAQIKQKKWENDQAEKHKKVNLNTVDWNDNPDRYILELAGKPSYTSTFKR